MNAPTKSQQMKTAGQAAEQKSAEDTSGIVGCPLSGNAWVEIQLVGDEDAPIRDMECIVTDAKDKQHKGKTDASGILQITGMARGECKVTFPKLDKDAWGPEPDKKDS